MVRQIPSSTHEAKQFDATLERVHRTGMNWVIARVPFNVEKKWGTRGVLKVHVRVNDFDYRGVLMPDGSGGHYFIVNKKMQKGARILPGQTATFTVAPDLAPRVVQVPAELEQALKQEPALSKWFESLAHSVRKWLADIVGNAQSPEARKRRADRVAEQILEAMEAELQLPPMVQLALRRHPGGERAWKNMTPRQRRHNLLAIFYYRSPETRLRRLQRMLNDATS